jgi:hypothetical protein
MSWYGRAARNSGGDQLAYSAPVGNERFGRMMKVGGGYVSPGLPEAARRLVALKASVRANRFQCTTTTTGAGPEDAGSENWSSVVALIDSFLAFSRVRPTANGLQAFFKPRDLTTNTRLEPWATPRDGHAGPIDGKFSYMPISCFEGGRRAELAGPDRLCANASSVLRYSFHLNSADNYCASSDKVEQFLVKRGWSVPVPEVPQGRLNAQIMPPLNLRLIDGKGSLIIASPAISGKCVSDFELYRPI